MRLPHDNGVVEGIIWFSETLRDQLCPWCTPKDTDFVITEAVLYYCGQRPNATVGVGVGRKVTIVLLYRLWDV